ncbi:MAG: hypothetical protein CVV42_12855 [Candidatus Riflebacteria bacterium HGW-Riflebacteria-2]|jgi:hypothetical protein|nr:MAG: hypothetical protein CVV42_12855 [Candidatus Riflebacteria bacterium HGW-Riflebacteria-2]
MALRLVQLDRSNPVFLLELDRVKKNYTKIACIGQNPVPLGFVAAKASYSLQHANFLLPISRQTEPGCYRPLKEARTLSSRATYCLLLALFALITVAPACFADNEASIASLLTRSLRSYEAHRPMEAEEWWRKASELEPKLARPPWLTPGQELPADLYVHSTENTGYSLWGLFMRLLSLPLLMLLLIWQGWQAFQDLRENISANRGKAVSQPKACSECARLKQECQKLQRKIELLQGSASGRID